MRIKQYILFLLLLVCSFNIFSQQVRVDAVLDTSKIRIGEQVKVDLYLSYDANLKNVKVRWPSIGDTLTGKIEVVSVSAIDTTFPNKSNSSKIFQHQQVVVSVYDSGFYAIPPFKFELNNDSANNIYTRPLFLEVHTVPTDTSATKLKDIKPPFEEKFNWKWYLDYIYWGIAILLLIIAIILITLYISRKKKQVASEPEKPKIPAHITALAHLEKIRLEQVWKEGQVKEYYSEISDTIRQYIQDRYGVNAPESTTDEIMKAFRSQVVDRDSKEKLEQLLTLSDLVKFAKMFPIEAENTFTLQNAFDFVNGTKREEEMQVDAVSEPVIVQSPYAPGATSVQKEKSDYSPPVKPLSPPVDPIRNFSEPAVKKVDSMKKKRIFLIIGTLLGLAAGYILFEFFFGQPTIADRLDEVSKGINKQCPITLDRYTRLDSTAATEGKTFAYYYTLSGITGLELNPGLIKSKMEPGVLHEVRTNPKLKLARDNNVIMKYIYSDMTGRFLFDIKVTPADYKETI